VAAVILQVRSARLVISFVTWCVRRKADLRELKRLHVQENRLMQAMASKALAAKEEQAKKLEIDKQVNLRIIHVRMCLYMPSVL